VYLVAIEAAHLTVIHHALNEVVALHSILVSSGVCPIEEVGRTKTMFLERPVVGQTLSGKESYGPIEILSHNWIRERLSLAVALNADVISPNGIERFGIHDVVARGM